MTAILDLLKMECHTVFCGHTTVHYVGRTRKSHGRHQNHESATILKKMISIYCFDLEHMAAILDFTHNAKS